MENREQSIYKVIYDDVFEQSKQGENDYHRARQTMSGIYLGEVSYRERTIQGPRQYRCVTDRKNPLVPICRLTQKKSMVGRCCTSLFFFRPAYTSACTSGCICASAPGQWCKLLDMCQLKESGVNSQLIVLSLLARLYVIYT